jgi:chemotaxis protein methyltransferase CheR
MSSTETPMDTHASQILDRGPLPPKVFQALRDLLHQHCGIALSPSKLTMVQSRLAKRLRKLGLQSYEDYLDVLRDPAAEEWTEFINALTTNLTSFFREEHHFTRLVELIRPTFERTRKIRIWSAGCSTGEEPYTLAMTLQHAFGAQASIQIIASDLDTSVLETAARGVYPVDRIEALPLSWKQFGFLKGKGANQGSVRVRPELRARVSFQQMNLRDADWPIDGPFQAIFCRNVMIYFDKPTQKNLLARYHRLLEPEGLLFVGHSESLLDNTSGFQSLGQTIYRRKATNP